MVGSTWPLGVAGGRLVGCEPCSRTGGRHDRRRLTWASNREKRAAKKKVKAARVSMSYMKSKNGKRFVVFRVNSSKSKAKVRIRLLSKHGHTIKVVTRTIRANRLVTIRVTTKCKKARVALVR